MSRWSLQTVTNMLSLTWAILSALTLSVSAGNKIWDGSFNPFTTATDFDKCMYLPPPHLLFDVQ